MFEAQPFRSKRCVLVKCKSTGYKFRLSMNTKNLSPEDFELAKSHFLNGLEFFGKEMYSEAEISFRASLSLRNIPSPEQGASTTIKSK